jgi:hypothetical protein
MQSLIEMINMPAEEQALREGIEKQIAELAFDPHGTHVLQRVLLCLQEDNIDFIFDPILANFVDLSMDQNGLCVIKKIITKVQGHDKRQKIADILSLHAVQLVQNAYGNYAVQQALDVSESIPKIRFPHFTSIMVSLLCNVYACRTGHWSTARRSSFVWSRT